MRHELPAVNVDPDKAAALIAQADKELDEPYPELSLAEYALFARSGDRVTYERPYFRRREMLITFALAQWLEPTHAYRERMIQGINLILDEASWCLPAHNTYVRDTPALPQPDPSRPIIDLFAAETGAALAVIQSLIPLDGGLQARVERAWETRILIPYRTRHFWWMGNGDEAMCNWTPWCTSNVLLAAYLTGHADAWISRKAMYSLQCFLKDIGEDGGYPEGVEYWTHAALPLVVCLKVLKLMGCREAEQLEKERKVKALLAFPEAMHASGPWYLNWGGLLGQAGCRRRTPCLERDPLRME